MNHADIAAVMVPEMMESFGVIIGAFVAMATLWHAWKCLWWFARFLAWTVAASIAAFSLYCAFVVLRNPDMCVALHHVVRDAWDAIGRDSQRIVTTMEAVGRSAGRFVEVAGRWFFA